jgi:hypothetical protein
VIDVRAPQGSMTEPDDGPIASGDRHLILHYHIKNAGTSLDRTLERNFGARWTALESPERGVRVLEPEFLDYVTRHPSLAAISSQAMAPLRSVTPGLATISILFLRHPIDRARSIWEFNQRQAAPAHPAGPADDGAP